MAIFKVIMYIVLFIWPIKTTNCCDKWYYRDICEYPTNRSVAQKIEQTLDVSCHDTHRFIEVLYAAVWTKQSGDNVFKLCNMFFDTIEKELKKPEVVQEVKSVHSNDIDDRARSFAYFVRKTFGPKLYSARFRFNISNILEILQEQYGMDSSQSDFLRALAAADLYKNGFDNIPMQNVTVVELEAILDHPSQNLSAKLESAYGETFEIAKCLSLELRQRMLFNWAYTMLSVDLMHESIVPYSIRRYNKFFKETIHGAAQYDEEYEEVRMLYYGVVDVVPIYGACEYAAVDLVNAISKCYGEIEGSDEFNQCGFNLSCTVTKCWRLCVAGQQIDAKFCAIVPPDVLNNGYGTLECTVLDNYFKVKNPGHDVAKTDCDCFQLAPLVFDALGGENGDALNHTAQQSFLIQYQALMESAEVQKELDCFKEYSEHQSDARWKACKPTQIEIAKRVINMSVARMGQPDARK